jgi:hypothetical protein
VNVVGNDLRFEREGRRFARWVGGEEWTKREALHRLFAEAEGVAPEQVEELSRTNRQPDDDSAVGQPLEQRCNFG